MHAQNMNDALVQALTHHNNGQSATVTALPGPARTIRARGLATPNDDGQLILTRRGLDRARQIAADPGYRPDTRPERTQHLAQLIRDQVCNCLAQRVGNRVTLRMYSENPVNARTYLSRARALMADTPGVELADRELVRPSGGRYVALLDVTITR